MAYIVGSHGYTMALGAMMIRRSLAPLRRPVTTLVAIAICHVNYTGLITLHTVGLR